MRVTSGMLNLSFTTRLHERGRTLWDAYDRIASGKRVRKPGDDPSATARILQLQRQLTESEQYKANIGEARLWLELTDSSLERLGDISARARELAVSGASDTMPPESRAGLADEVDELFEHTIQLGNSSLAERHLFAGQRTLTVPYRITGYNSYEFDGETGSLQRQVARSTNVVVNVAGPRVVDPLLDVLAELSSALRAGDGPLINDILTRIDVAHDATLAARAEVGARIERLERSEQKMADEAINVTRQLSDRQDADMAEALIDLRLAEAGYEAALTATARVFQQTLIDYLR